MSCHMPSAQLTEFEQERARIMARNAAVMESLGLKSLASDFASSLQASWPRPRKRAQPRKRAATEVVEASRRSVRQKGLPPEGTASKESSCSDCDNDLSAANEELLTCEQYFKRQGKEGKALKVSGSFEGWVSPALCTMYGIPESADLPVRNKVPVQAQGLAQKGAGWSQAQCRAAKQLRSNPNAYFYRHVAPHETQAQGNWTLEEQALFLKTAKAFGAGDKWGLFASYIPKRVGYQCSAFYRDVIIPQGLVYDPRFRISKSGRPVYVG